MDLATNKCFILVNGIVGDLYGTYYVTSIANNQRSITLSKKRDDAQIFKHELDARFTESRVRGQTVEPIEYDPTLYRTITLFVK